jgi:acyl-CoA synthetase (NDP forming)
MNELIPAEYRKLAACFAPKSAAIVGASTDPRKFGGKALKFCLERGYAGRLYPINPGSAEVQGVKAYARLSDLPEAPEIAVIAVPAPQVRDAVAEAAEIGARVAIVYGAQFAEIGQEGKARQDELVALARSRGMRLVGPNCMGIIALASGFVASFTTAPEHHGGKGWPDVGTVSVASQSGAVGIQMFAQLRDRGLGLANWISTGNQADIDVADAIAYFAEDPATKTIAIYMEDASRGLKLLRALELARRARKPVVVLKVGTTPQGGVAAAGHTASLYVEDRVVDDLFARAAVLRARTISELIDLVAACDAGAIPRGPDTAAISVSGGGAVMIADAAAKNGLTLPAFDAEALRALKATNSFVNDRNPIDISAPSMSQMEITGGHLEWGLAQGRASMLGYISHIPLVPRTRDGIMPYLLGLRAKAPDRAIVVAMNAGAEDRKALVRAGVAVFEDPILATEALAKLVRAGAAFERPAHEPAAEPKASAGAADIRALLAGHGIAMTPERAVATASDALMAAREFGGAIVLKLDGPGLIHRTDVGGVELGLALPAAIEAAHARLAARARDLASTHRDLRIVASPMAEGIEYLLAVRRDPHFGPLVVLASGGTDVALWDDATYLKPPFGREEAEAAIARVRVSRKLGGWRGRPPADRAALIDALLAAGRLAVDPRAAGWAFELNPLFVGARGAVGADLAVFAPGRQA